MNNVLHNKLQVLSVIKHIFIADQILNLALDIKLDKFQLKTY